MAEKGTKGVIDIYWHKKGDRFEFESNLSLCGQQIVLEEFLRRQIGAGADNRQANEREVYHLQLTWSPHMDRINSSDDTGNLRLRDGILYDYLNKVVYTGLEREAIQSDV